MNIIHGWSQEYQGKLIYHLMIIFVICIHLLIYSLFVYAFIFIYIHIFLCRCIEHDCCEHLLKVGTDMNLDGTYSVFECGLHFEVYAKRTVGIHASLIEEVDTYCRMNATPKKILQELTSKYKGTDFFSVLPSLTNIKNRKKTVQKSAVKIQCLNDLRNFLIDKKVIPRKY